VKGIILAGGTGSRLFPITNFISKQLLPVYDKPMVYYPLSTLMLAGISEILIITTKRDLPLFQVLFSDGRQLGLSLEYKIQDEPKGIVEAFIIAKDFIKDQKVCLILGDNLFYSQDLSRVLNESAKLKSGALILGYPVKNPSEFGVVEFDDDNIVLSIEEKPSEPKSDFAIPGIYFYDESVYRRALKVMPSARGELEITDLNRSYMDENLLYVKPLGRGFAWLDTGSIDALNNASEFVESIQKRQGFYISCIEEIAWRKGLININQLMKLGLKQKNSEYGKYILSLVDDYMKRVYR
jgi:glucose-1-phosphate thymidylyltransferase